MKRDPRIEPKAGDRLRDVNEPARDFVRKVERVTGARVGPARIRRVVYHHQYYNWAASCSLATWRRWAKTAEVLHCAE